MLLATRRPKFFVLCHKKSIEIAIRGLVTILHLQVINHSMRERSSYQTCILLIQSYSSVGHLSQMKLAASASVFRSHILRKGCYTVAFIVVNDLAVHIHSDQVGVP